MDIEKNDEPIVKQVENDEVPILNEVIEPVASTNKVKKPRTEKQKKALEAMKRL